MKKLMVYFWSSPGPKNLKEGLELSLKGLFMGAADIIPGVSGGTIALITGIYENLLTAIQSFDKRSITYLFTFNWAAFFKNTRIRFLSFLGLGIALSILSMSRVMNYLLNNHPIPTWSLFFGLITASIWILAKQIPRKNLPSIIFFIIGSVLAYLLVGLIPTQTPEAYWFIFLSGVLAICAMILPGISGAFILLILGKYEFITSTLKNPFSLENILVILVFCVGAVLGLTTFSRFLSFFLKRYHSLTLSFLTGLMTGSLRKIWPWKKILETAQVGHKEFIIKAENVLPSHMDGEFYLALGCMAAGMVAVYFLDKMAYKND